MTCWMALAPSTGSPKACVVSHLPHLCWSSPHFSTALVPVALYPLACQDPQETAVVRNPQATNKERQERAHGQKNCAQYLTVFAPPPPTFCCLHFRTMTTISKMKWFAQLARLSSGACSNGLERGFRAKTDVSYTRVNVCEPFPSIFPWSATVSQNGTRAP